MPLMGDRYLSVTRIAEPHTRAVAVFGLSYTDSAGHRESRHAEASRVFEPPAHHGAIRSQAQVSPTSVIEVWVERHDQSKGEDFGWTRITTQVHRDSELAGTHSRLVRKPTARSGSAWAGRVPGRLGDPDLVGVDPLDKSLPRQAYGPGG